MNSLEVTTKKKRSGYDFWRTDLKGARYAVAPMVDQSELAWRLLSKRYNAELCYTPMIHASVFIRDEHYRKESIISCSEDRPLIVQFCANDADVLLKAAKLAEPFCEAIDLNLGCPQSIAKRGHYGVFLQDEWDLLHKMISLCNEQLNVPITCKIRIFEDLDKTVKYAQMLESAGCQLLTVHGRTKEQKGIDTGLANWDYIKAVKDAVKIPVFANGNIQYLDDVKRCIEQTGVDGVMTAEGNLHNPALFVGINPPVWKMAEEYLKLVQKYPCPLSYIRGHLFKLFHHALQIHLDLREILGKGRNLGDMLKVTESVKQRCQEDMDKAKNDPELFKSYNLPLPHWLCQPYVRPPRSNDKQNTENVEHIARKRQNEQVILDENGQPLSRNKVKKLLRCPKKLLNNKQKTTYEICSTCSNPKGGKCEHQLCKKCCKSKTSTEYLNCDGHRFSFKLKRPELDHDNTEKLNEKSDSVCDTRTTCDS